jgi:hypothetical protein
MANGIPELSVPPGTEQYVGKLPYSRHVRKIGLGFIDVRKPPPI